MRGAIAACSDLARGCPGGISAATKSRTDYFFSDEPAEVVRRAGKRRATDLGDPCLRPRIDKSGVELLVELLHDLGRHAAWRANTVPGARLITSQEIAHRRNVREEVRTCRRCDRPQPH